MIEAIVLGVIQGVAEWLPISSEGAIIYVKNNFFQSGIEFQDLLREALFLHLGTFFAALIYLRKEVSKILETLFKYKKAEEEDKKVLIFLLITTFVSGLVGCTVIYSVSKFSDPLKTGGYFLNILIALMLFITSFLQFKSKKGGLKTEKNLTLTDGLILGIAQGFSSLPGLSRSGLTVSALLIKKFDDTVALRLSFLMSMPVVLLGNIFFYYDGFKLTINSLISLTLAFIFGLITIKYLLKLAKRIHFGYFTLIFGVLVIFSIFV